ncbi:hypothetical protein AC579_7052 [Pseudocercospora musae]|uniref:Uncharacterized protein n=1 Tax=Pseudocercospora musae TaxID=113226 RepID=A0A139IAH5_9PEZI|nr:hypothetical protein AC579_7052 [Pseudocercospora musae]
MAGGSQDVAEKLRDRLQGPKNRHELVVRRRSVVSSISPIFSLVFISILKSLSQVLDTSNIKPDRTCQAKFSKNYHGKTTLPLDLVIKFGAMVPNTALSKVHSISGAVEFLVSVLWGCAKVPSIPSVSLVIKREKDTIFTSRVLRVFASAEAVEDPSVYALSISGVWTGPTWATVIAFNSIRLAGVFISDSRTIKRPSLFIHISLSFNTRPELTLYRKDGACSTATHISLEELRLPFTDIPMKEDHNRKYDCTSRLEIPGYHEKTSRRSACVPVLVVDGTVIIELFAVLLHTYLNPQRGFTGLTPIEQAMVLEWRPG